MGTLKVSEKRNVLDPCNITFEERTRQIEAEQKAEAEARKREKNSPTRPTFDYVGHTY